MKVAEVQAARKDSKDGDDGFVVCVGMMFLTDECWSFSDIFTFCILLRRGSGSFGQPEMFLFVRMSLTESVCRSCL